MATHDTRVKQFRLKLYVSDLTTRRRFYEEVIGWPMLTEFESGVMYDTGAAVFELLRHPEPEPHSSSCDVSLEVDDVHTLWRRLENCAKVVFPLRDNPWGDTSFCIADPGGFRLTFFSLTSAPDDRDSEID
jgi:predicted enzyme related to lactoylglutathione lyase